MRRETRTPNLYGRSRELDTLRGVVDKTGGGAQLAFLEGEPGIGKTSLLAATLRASDEAGLRTFLGRADELERRRPFGPLLDAFSVRPTSGDPRVAAIAELVATSEGGTSVEPGGTEFRVAEAFLDLIEATSFDRPIVLGIDDLQWSDPATLLVLSGIGRRLSDLPLAVIGAYRGVPPRPELQRIFEIFHDRAIRVGLTPLNTDAVMSLARETLGADPDEDLAAQLGATGGNPFYVIELVRAISEDPAVRREGDARVTALPTPLRLTVLRRLSLLSEQTLGILRTASLLGSVFAIEDVATVRGITASSVLEELREATDLGFVADRAGRLGFRHDLLRESLYEDIPAAARSALHREAARALAAARASPIQVAEQFSLGAMPDDEEAITWIRRAAKDAMSRSTSVAVELLERALSLCERATPARIEIVGELAVLLVVAGRAPDAEPLIRQVEAGSIDPSVEAALGIALAEATWNRGDVKRARELFQQTAALPNSAEPHRSIAAAFEAQLRFLSGDVDTAARKAEAARNGADPRVHQPIEVAVLETQALTAAADGRIDHAIELASRAEQLTAQVESEWQSYLYPNNYLSIVLLEADRFEEVKNSIQRGRLAAESLGNVSWLPLLQFVGAGMHYFAGRWPDAIAEAEAGLSLVEEVGNQYGIPYPYAIMTLVAVHRNDLATAADMLNEGERRMLETGPGMGADLLMWGRGLLTQARGRSEEALSIYEGVWRVMTLYRYFLSYRSLGPDLVSLARGHGRLDTARAVTEFIEEGARRSDIPTIQGAALRCRGLLEGDASTLVSAVEAYREGPRPLEFAFACEDAGRTLAESGKTEDAIRFFEEALSVYRDLGAAYDGSRASASLRALGVRRVARAPRKRSMMGWPSLTTTEELVARLAAKRLTNGEIAQQLFISKRTVQTHLQHIFGKLTIASRRELAAHVPPD